MNVRLVLPLMIPMLTAIATLLAMRRRALQRALSLAGAAALLGAACSLLDDVWYHGIQSVQIGNWPAPYGITLVSDLFSAIMVTLTGVTGMKRSGRHRRSSMSWLRRGQTKLPNPCLLYGSCPSACWRC